MPFDGNPAKFAKPDVFSLPALIAWLEKQSRDEEYSYADADSCLLGRYVKCSGGTLDWIRAEYVIGDRRLGVYTHQIGELHRVIQGHGRYTFGAALDRARQLLARDG